MHLRVGPSSLVSDYESSVGIVLYALLQHAIQSKRLPDWKSLTQHRLSFAERRPMTVDGACWQKISLIMLLMSMIIYLQEFLYQRVFPRRHFKTSCRLVFFKFVKVDDEY
jgi:hypothetical protein